MGAYYIFSCLAMLLYWALLVDFAVAGHIFPDLCDGFSDHQSHQILENLEIRFFEKNRIENTTWGLVIF